MTDRSMVTGSTSRLLDKVVADIVRAEESQTPLDRDKLLGEHPQIADDLRDFFRHRDRMKRLLDPICDAAKRVLNIRCPYCHRGIEVADHSQFSELTCPDCERQFSLVATEGQDRYPPGLERIGQFQLIERVGVGRFGSVWRARDLTLERTVAIKIPRNKQLSEHETEMFLRDARLAAQLQHPHIVGVHEVGRHNDTIYIVSDFIQGLSLKERIAKSRLGIREATELSAKVGTALHHAHEMGVVHRDLKPGNIMIDLAGEPHIVDFGLAKREQGEVTITEEGQLLGTPAYMSPEQAKGDGHDVDRTADVYSLGVVMYELLTGELPFRGDQRMLLLQIVHDAPLSPRKLNSAIPRDLETICLKCLEKEPRHRYESTQEFAEECQRFLERKPILARPISRPVQAWRWCRKNALVTALLAAVGLLIFSVAAVSSIGFVSTQAALRVSRNQGEIIERNLYFSEINRAAVAAQQADGVAQVAALLANWRPKGRQTDRRGWEWYYLNAQLVQDVATLTGYEGGVFSLEWDQAGKLLAVGGANGELTMWSADGVPVGRKSPHAAQVNALALNNENSLLASASMDGTVKVWRYPELTLHKELAHEGPVYSVAWSPQGDLLALSHEVPHADSRSDSRVSLYSTKDWLLAHDYDVDNSIIEAVSWHPQRKRIGMGSPVEIRIWDYEASQRSPQLIGNGGQIIWNRQGDLYATEEVGTLRIAEEGEQRALISTPMQTYGAISWSPSENKLAFNSSSRVVEVLDLDAPNKNKVLRGHESRITAICWHPRGHRVATASIDGNIKLWRTRVTSPFTDGSNTISWSPNGNKYVSRDGNSALIYDIDTSKIEQELVGHPTHIYLASWSPDGLSIATMGYAFEPHPGELRVWDAHTGELRFSLQNRLVEKNNLARLPAHLAWSPDGSQLAFPYDATTINVVDAQTGETQHRLLGLKSEILTLAWNSQHDSIAAVSSDNRLMTWNSRDGHRISANEFASTSALSFDPNGSILAAASPDGNIYLWNVTESRLAKTLEGHTTYVHAISWNAAGDRLASADEAGKILIWDTETGQQALELSYPGGVPAIAWNPLRPILAAVGYGGGEAVRLFDARLPPQSPPYW